MTQGHRSSSSYFDSLRQSNLIRPLETSGIPGFRTDPSKKHFACVQGSASIVKHFFEQASIPKTNMNFNRRAVQIAPTSTGMVKVRADNGEEDTFDLVVSTMPAPQILQLENISEIVADRTVKEKLEAVKYSTRFALGIFFDKDVQMQSSNQPLNFVENNQVIRFWSIENLKRNGSYVGPTSVVVHTSIDFGAENAEKDKEEMKPVLMKNLTTTILPEASNVDHDAVKSHKWRFSQVLHSCPGKPGCLPLTDQIYAAGDSFSESGLEGCINSAEKAVECIASTLKQ